MGVEPRHILVVADDLTGANDTAIQFRPLGPAVTVLAPEYLGAFGDFPVVALTTESRALPAPEAAVRLREAAARVHALQPAPLVYKKLDSSLRGQLGVEIEALLDGLALDFALVAPAYPAQGRVTAGGYHLVHQVPVGESDARRDPLTPVTESHLARLLASQTRLPVAHLALDTVLTGPAAVRDEVDRLVAGGARLVTADATTPDHLVTLAESAVSRPGALLCGSAGLAQALSRQLAVENVGVADGRDKAVDEARAAAREPAGTLVLCGSQTQAAFRQVDRVRETGAAEVWGLDPTELREPTSRAMVVARLVDQLGSALGSGRSAVVYVPRKPGTPPEDAAAILLALGGIGSGLAGLSRRMVLTGGDTAMAACSALGATALLVEGELLPGIVESRLVAPGGAADGRSVVTKSGSFGGDDTLLRLL